jgi:glycosyl hydrolase family 5/cellulase (glycosyl hydrolase family 5)
MEVKMESKMEVKPESQQECWVKIEGRHFADMQNRITILRGINLAGVSTSFSPNGATHLKNNWPPNSPKDIEQISWMNRPFPLEEADQHYQRLKNWGFNCVRFLTSWEAIEHAGPYKYDEEYLDFIVELIRRAKDFGLHVFINFHQDCWSRVSGGDGHPLWLYDIVGLDYTKFNEGDAAINMQYLWDSDPEKNKYGEQAWSENSKLFPPRTMWTLFWAGADFAPQLKAKDEKSGELLNIQEYMQRHYFAAMEKIAQRVKNMPHVIGFNPINEPSYGYIGLPLSMGDDGVPGIAWSPFDTMITASGASREIDKIGFKILSLKPGLRKVGTQVVNSKEIRLWKPQREDIWQQHGVWGEKDGEPVILKEDYFQRLSKSSSHPEEEDHQVDFTADYLVPFHERAGEMFHKYNKHWLNLIENDPDLNGSVRYHQYPPKMPKNTVDAFHWYDLIQLGLKRFPWPLTLDLVKIRPVWGMKGIQKMYVQQLKPHIEMGKSINSGNCPFLVGEYGISMDMAGGKAFNKYKKIGNKAFQPHENILNLMYNAFDELFLSGTLWNYNAYNTNENGDLWNQEDLSVYSQDQDQNQKSTTKNSATADIYAGARGLRGFCRPYAQKIAGHPIEMKFNWKSAQFTLKYRIDPLIEGNTEIFLPHLWYSEGYIVEGEKIQINLTYSEKSQLLSLSEQETDNVIKKDPIRVIVIKPKRKK